MTDDFTKYEAMRNSGVASEDVYRAAMQDGLDAITRIRLIRVIYSLSLTQAKEVIVRAEGQASSLDDYQSKIADKLRGRPPDRLGGDFQR